MQIYIEFALIENFCMDFFLLAIAKTAVKNSARYSKIALASLLGAVFAVCFPLIKVPSALGVAIKVVSGIAISFVGGKFSSFKGYVKFTLVFFAATALVGGATVGIFSLCGIDYLSGQGYILSSVPIGIPLFLATSTLILVKKVISKFRVGSVKEYKCKIYLNGKVVPCSAFYDSGNCVYLHGSPVSVLPSHIAAMLVDVTKINKFAHITTVAGECKLPVFTADKIEIFNGDRVTVKSRVLLGVSQKYISKAVLHPNLWEAT